MTDIRKGYAIPVDPLNELGDPEVAFKNPTQLQFMRTLLEIIRRMFAKFVDRDTATPYVTLRTAAGKTYRVEVTDAGQLTATYLRG